MLMQTKDLIGPALDWAVAKCLGYVHKDGNVYLNMYSPSTNWVQGGPIIEWECICTYASGACSVAPKNPDYWVAEILMTEGMLTQYGPTPLIAAMRCYVASKLGEQVEIPDELVNI